MLFQWCVGDQIKTIETGVNDLSGLYLFQLPDGSPLISLHGNDAKPNGSRLGSGRAYLQLIDVQSELQITDQVVEGDFTSLEG